MKLVNDKKNSGQQIDLDALIEEAFQKYDAVFFSEIENELFVYRPIGRKEYKDIVTNQNLDDYSKQDAICKTVLIFPIDFDFDNCLAGIPNELCNQIIQPLNPSMINAMKNQTKVKMPTFSIAFA